jgi:hypothetical protein
MLTYRAMRWKLFGPEPTWPQSPYFHVFPRRPPTILLTALERSSADILSIFSFPFFLFPVASGIQADEHCKIVQERFDLILTLPHCDLLSGP